MSRFIRLTLFFLLVISGSLFAATPDCTSKHVDIPDLGLCVWDSNSDGNPDSAGVVCPTDYLSVWARPYGAVNLTSRCLPSYYFGKQHLITLGVTHMYVLTCTTNWTTTPAGVPSCPVANQVVSDISTGLLWQGFDAYFIQAFNNIDYSTFWWVFGALSSTWIIGFSLGMYSKFLRRV